MNLKELRELAEEAAAACYGEPVSKYRYATHPKAIIKLLDVIEAMKTALEFYNNDALYFKDQGIYHIILDNGTTADFALEAYNKEFGE